MKTAVEWLKKQMIKDNIFSNEEWELFHQAKEMEKQQIIDARVDGMVKGIEIGSNPIDYDLHKTHEQYYRKTYGKE